MKILFSLVTLVSACSFCAIPSRAQRLIGQADYYEVGTGQPWLMDSVHFSYSGNRHSSFNYNGFGSSRISYLSPNKFNSFFMLTLDGSPISDTLACPDLAYDRMDYYHSEKSDTPATYRWSQENRYTAASIPLTCTSFFDDGSARYDIAQDSIVYGIGGRMERVYRFTSNGMSVDSTALRTLVYDSNGRLVTDSTALRYCGKLWPDVNTQITYNSSGQKSAYKVFYYKSCKDSVSLIMQNTLSYYPNGKLKTWYYERFNGSYVAQERFLDSFGYVPAFNGFVYEKIYEMDTGGVLTGNFSVQQVHLNAKSLPDTLSSYRVTNGIAGPSGHYVYNYGAGPFPISVDNYAATGPSSWQHISTFKYYYEDYQSAGVSYTAQPVVIVFPNPTNGSVQLKNLPREEVILEIWDCLGRLVYNSRLMVKDPSISLSDPAFSTPGVYTLQVRGADGRKLFSGRFVKQ